MTKKKTNTGKELPVQPKKEKTANATAFRIPYPYLWLALVVLALYGSSVNLSFTELDDSIFIKETSNYNKEISNLITSFKRGVFNVTEDVYYRPLLLDSFVLNYQLSGINIKGYHVVNILFHLVSVLLLFVLLKKLRLPEVHAFLLILLFAVHPVLSQAVVWIPGRNDTLLAVFTFSFFICAINYSEEGKTRWLLLQFFMLVLAFFTKETAVFAMPVAFIMLLFLLGKKWLERKNIVLYASWVFAFACWIFIRSQATLKNEQMQLTQVIAALPFRLPVLLQYLGKIILPVNLSVFPIMKDTPYIFGILAVLLITAGIYFAKKKNVNVIVAGISIYILFLLPALLVPSSLNDQDFEHRLYLPIIGILILLTQTVLFQNNLQTRQRFFYGLGLCTILAIVNFFHQQKFSDPVTFWKEAVRTSPHSAYANMMLGARLDKADPVRAETLIRTAYSLNPDEKYLNYYMGKMMLDKDSVNAAEKFFEKEIRKSNYYECYFHMARIAFTKNDFSKAIEYLNIYLSKAPADPQANNNLLLLYMQTRQQDRAKMQMQKMQQMGLEVPADILRQLKQ
jgi:tetratricopeptide (TPR) repeat protein